MKMFKYFGYALLLVAVPFAFVVVGTIIISALIACLVTLATDTTFTVSFKDCVASGALEFLLAVFAIIGTVMYIDSVRD